MIYRHRKQNRLKNFDYSSSGCYFVTICTKNRECLFGEIIDGKMALNEYGKIVNKYWLEISKHFANIVLDEFVVMPNHVHGIIIIRNTNQPVGAGFPRPFWSSRPILGQIIGYFKYQSTKYINDFMEGSDDPTPTIKQNKIKQIFQRSFYDHIIRNEYSLFEIRQYIRDNPKNWDEDRNNIK